MYEKVLESFSRLHGYCLRENFMGYDPYDGLNSTFFQSLPVIRDSRLARLAWIQGFKRSPVNFRKLAGISKGYNPKALGLFLSGYCSLYAADPKKEYLEKISFFIEKLKDLSTPGYSGMCWGYNFDWESKAFFQPKYTPTIVVSSFVANALLDAYEILSDDTLLKAARSTCDFILKDLNRSYDNKGNFAFSYSKLDKSIVYNASLLGSRLLARVYSYTGEQFLIDEAGKSISYCCSAQREDGSWSYGTLPFHQWIDNFHTGFNLECISDFIKFTGDNSFKENLDRGFDYYVKTFFTEKGLSKYYNNSIYPVDIHAPAQLIITLSTLGKFEENRELADRVLSWTIDNMQTDKGFFYYQIKTHYKISIPYMRWSQAWVFHALTKYLQISKQIE
jgi:rhamnogalacturonyl hydrolase YesR